MFKWVPQKIHNGRSNNLYKALVALSDKHHPVLGGLKMMVLWESVRHATPQQSKRHRL